MSGLRLCAVAAGLLLWLGCWPAPVPPDGILLREMQLRLGAAEQPPEAGSAEWRSVSMPDTWDLRRRSRFLEGWYRASVELPTGETDGASRALLLPGFSGHVTIWWNGRRIGDSGPYRENDTRHARGPLILLLPVGAAAGDLAIRFRATPAVTDFLAAPRIGPRDALHAEYQRRLIFSRLAPLVFSAAGVLVALLLLLVYPRDADVAYVPWLAAGLLSSSLAALALFAPLDALPPRLVEPLRPALFHLTMPCFAIALHRLRGIERPRLERLLLGVWAGFAVLAFAVPLILTFAVAVLWSIPTLVVASYVLVLAIGAARRLAGRRRFALLLPLLAALGFALHDAWALWRDGGADPLLSPYSTAMVTLSLFWLHLASSRDALVASRELNRELDARVEEKRGELERNYERLRRAEREQAVLAERERLLRDMHDGLGGQLVSTLAMVESGRFEPDELAEALRDSLDDLRLMVHSLDPAEADLLSMLAVVRERIGPRLARHGLRFEWHVEDVPDPGLEAAGVLQVLRIVQEVLTNIVKHAAASTIELETGSGRDSAGPFLFLAISDDGKGLPDERGSGRGIANMRARAAGLGGSLTLERRPERPGTRVMLRLPLSDARAGA